MSFNVNDFRSELSGDGARPNLFKVVIPFFPIFAQGNPASRKLEFMARATQLPGSTVNQVPVMYFGREVKFSGNRTFADWNITIINDEDFLIRNSFERWLAGLNSHIGNLRNRDAINNASYQSDAFIVQYGKSGRTLKQYRLVGLFPTDVSPIELDWSANDTIEEFAVTFSYQYWEASDRSHIGNEAAIA